jgi:uncharacterized protein YjeT (DUF2065 family)
MDAHPLWVGLGLLLVFEGLMPLVAPRQWREMFLALARLRDGQIRFFGLVAVVIGGFLLLVE